MVWKGLEASDERLKARTTASSSTNVDERYRRIRAELFEPAAARYESYERPGLS